MPCIFCIAVFAMLTTAVTTAVLDQLEARLATEAATRIRRSESGSVARYEFEFPVPPPGRRRGRAGALTAPVALTVYKRYGRVRIQVLTHDLERGQSEALQRRIAALAGLRVVEWSTPQSEQKVREAVEAESGVQSTGWDAPPQPRPRPNP
jgi:hypothetical protein